MKDFALKNGLFLLCEGWEIIYDAFIKRRENFAEKYDPIVGTIIFQICCDVVVVCSNPIYSKMGEKNGKNLCTRFFMK